MASRSVLVVGAGIAGLTTAYRLAKLGVDVTVLEASERVGGRMSTDQRDGYLIDRGAQFLSDGYSVICDLIGELGLGQHVARARGWTGTVRDRLTIAWSRPPPAAAHAWRYNSHESLYREAK